jgi:hypothetical protein
MWMRGIRGNSQLDILIYDSPIYNRWRLVSANEIMRYDQNSILALLTGIYYADTLTSRVCGYITNAADRSI